MNKVATAPRAAASEAAGKGERRILLFGDSHSHAIQRAIEKRVGKKQAVPLAAHRLLKEKNGKYIGDTTFEQFLKAIAKLDANDVVLSMIGGNQHAVFSTIQHPQPFDFFAPDGPAPARETEVVPYRALEDTFVRGLRSGDGKSLEALRKATAARVVHIIPPPPKADTAFIEKHHETRFAQEDLAQLGVSPPQFRLKFWRLQARVLEGICKVLGIEVMLPPARAVDEQGFLRPEFYGPDATHANWRYGERLLREVERRYLRLKRSPDRGAE